MNNSNSRDIPDTAHVNGRTISRSGPAQGTGRNDSFKGRPWLAIKWKCCQTYSRVYRRADATAYVGRCPKCQRQINVPVGQGGTSARFFEAG